MYSVADLQRESRDMRPDGTGLQQLTDARGLVREFAFGVDYVECGICKLYQRKGASELVPWICWLDYPLRMHSGSA